MKFINTQQLAFILDTTKTDARAMMCHAWSKNKGITNQAYHHPESGKIIDDYPQAMEIDMLAKELNLPMLQSSVDDITNNYLTRAASKKWILCDYPEKAIKAAEVNGKKFPIKLNIPPALKSMLNKSDIERIHTEWAQRYKNKIFDI